MCNRNKKKTDLLHPAACVYFMDECVFCVFPCVYVWTQNVSEINCNKPHNFGLLIKASENLFITFCLWKRRKKASPLFQNCRFNICSCLNVWNFPNIFGCNNLDAFYFYFDRFNYINAPSSRSIWITFDRNVCKTCGYFCLIFVGVEIFASISYGSYEYGSQNAFNFFAHICLGNWKKRQPHLKNHDNKSNIRIDFAWQVLNACFWLFSVSF